MGKLYLVSTPIGNLKDISLRALEVLKNCSTILCEDTRKTSQLLKKLEIDNQQKLIPFYERNAREQIPKVVSWLKEKDVALVSNAGTPLVSDPGFKLVRRCWQEGVVAVPIPGPSALLASLVASGLPPDKFWFVGFLPKKTSKINSILRAFASLDKQVGSTLIFYESPFRIKKTLDMIKSEIGDCQIAVCREMTKAHEEIVRGTPLSLLDYFKEHKVKGEITVVVSKE